MANAKKVKTEASVEAIDTSVLAQMASELEAPPAEILIDEPATPVTVVSLPEALQNVTEEDKAQMLTRIGSEFDARAATEKAANPANTNIQDTLKKQAKKMALPGIAAMILATNVDPGVINRSIIEGKRFNVYAIDKLNDLLHGLNSGHFKNEINQAVMRSMFKFRKAGVAFTGLAALAAASDKVIVDNALKGLLIRHTVAAATAPTQSSSTMSALIAIGAVVNKGSAKYPIYELTNAPVVDELAKKFA
jgi:hypothetical protein